MSSKTNGSLSPEQIAQIAAQAAQQAVAEAMASAGSEPAPKAGANRKQRRKAARTSYQHTAATVDTDASSKPAKGKPKADASAYGKAAVGLSATDTHNKRVQQLEAAIPGICKLANVASQGKVPGKGLETSMKECDRAGVGVWTFVELPGGNRKEADKLAKKATGLSMDQISTALKSCGYGFYSLDKVWRTRCDGTPALGRKGMGRQHAARHALQSGDDDE